MGQWFPFDFGEFLDIAKLFPEMTFAHERRPGIVRKLWSGFCSKVYTKNSGHVPCTKPTQEHLDAALLASGPASKISFPKPNFYPFIL